ncbi:MAG: signal recognition particle protein [Deltaproteobacteria bacterium]|nr:signal recognition particle protein [Deltaproteobacteria bacterium]
MFEGLQDRLSETFKKLRGHGTLNEKNIDDALREVRMALLEADVHYSVVKSFVGEVKTRAIGQDVMAGLNPYQEFVRIVNEELTRVMGGGDGQSLDLTGAPPVVVLMMGLQGSGKTTSTGKLALRLKADKKTPLLVPADVRRPAAIEQLKTLGRQAGVTVFDTKPGMAVPEIAKQAMAQAERQGQDVVVFDTAGRLHVDLELMDELRDLKELVKPKAALLVVDAMTGQDAVNVAQQFQQQVGIDGVVLTKMDGDARGGAALSVRMVTGAPILLVGTGEKLDKLEAFHPARVAQRILGMGDVLSLIEKTAGVYDEKKAKSMAKKLKKADFSLDDFRDQMKMIRQMGEMKDILKMLPGMDQAMRKMGPGGPDPDKELGKIEAMLSSMTPDERARPEIINGSRKKRIAAGSGTDVSELNGFLKRFNDMKKMMKKFTNLGPSGLKGMMRRMGMH